MEIWFFIGSFVFFALVAIYFSFRYDHESAKVAKQKKEIAHKVFELALLKSINDEIGYSLNLETVSETIALTIENVMDVSTVSYAIVEPTKVCVKTFPKEPVPPVIRIDFPLNISSFAGEVFERSPQHVRPRR